MKILKKETMTRCFLTTPTTKCHYDHTRNIPTTDLLNDFTTVSVFFCYFFVNLF